MKQDSWARDSGDEKDFNKTLDILGLGTKDCINVILAEQPPKRIEPCDTCRDVNPEKQRFDKFGDWYICPGCGCRFLLDS